MSLGGSARRAVVAPAARDAAPHRSRRRPPGTLRLDRNERPHPVSDDRFAALLAALSPADLCAYPDLEPFYDRLSATTGVPREHLLASSGADQALQWIFGTFVSSGDRVVHLYPCFHRYIRLGELHGADAVRVSCSPDASFDDGEVLDAVVPGTKLVLLDVPNNPTGHVLCDDTLAAVIARAARIGAVVALDEAYVPFHESRWIARVLETDHVVVVRSFSKAYGAAGLRLGFVAASRRLVGAMAQRKPTYEISAIAAKLGAFLLEQDAWAAEFVAQVREAREWLREELAARGLHSPPSAGNFCLVPMGSAVRAEAFAAHCLAQHRIAIASGLPAPLDDRVRVTVGTRNHAQAFVAALDAFVLEEARS